MKKPGQDRKKSGAFKNNSKLENEQALFQGVPEGSHLRELLRQTEHKFAAGRKLSREDAKRLLDRKGQASFEPALQFEERFGGLILDALHLGIGTILKMPVSFESEGGFQREAIAQLSQIGFAMPSEKEDLPAKYWMDARGRIFIEEALRWNAPVARNYQDFIEAALIKRESVGRDVHDYAASISGVSSGALADILRAEEGGLSLGGESLAVWDTQDAKICYGTHEVHGAPNGVVVSAGNLELFAQVLLRIQKINPAGAAFHLLNEAPFYIITGKTSKERYLSEVATVLGVLPGRRSREDGRTFLFRNSEEQLQWWTIASDAKDLPW